MNDQERHDMLERFIYMHESTMLPDKGTRGRAEAKAFELARPILLGIARFYADEEIAGIEFGMKQASQEHEALEESCDAYSAKQDSQFMKHVAALRQIMFAELRSEYMREFEHACGWKRGPNTMPSDLLAYCKLRDTQPTMSLGALAHRAQVAMSYVETPGYNAYDVLARVVDRVFREVRYG